MGLFLRRSRVDNSILCGPILSKFELLLDILNVLNTYKFKMDQINSNREKVATLIFRRSRAANSLAEFRTHLSSYVHVRHRYCKYEKDPIKTAEKSDNTVFPIINLWGFFPTLKGS